MCGILGSIALDRPIPAPDLQCGLDSLAHRGPDDAGSQAISGRDPRVRVWLGNRRLAILDLSPAGHQPMQDPATGNWIVHNGEVYNFRAIREKLAAEGVAFHSESDTEVVLKAYGRWGERCLDEFRGMFAFAIWDAARSRLFVARDRMGIKPLYYHVAGSRLLFGSEVRALLATGAVARRLNVDALDDFLAFGSVQDPDTLIEGVASLPAGHWMTWQDGHIEITRYWDLPTAPFAGDGQEATRELARLLEEAVRLRLVSDVPIGVFLSGGIDSSAIVALLARCGATEQVSTFSIVFREQEFNEAEFSRAIARKFGTRHHEILVSQSDVLQALPACIAAMDQPSIDGVNSYVVSREARRNGCKVALSGLGSDELFAGYSTFQTVPRMEALARNLSYFPGVLRRAGARVLTGVRSDVAARKLASLVSAEEQSPYAVARSLFWPSARRALLPRKKDGASESSAAALLTSAGLDPINRTSYSELRGYMLNTLLRDTDFMSMARSLEVRVPLIDHKLVELAFSLPGKMKRKRGIPKPLLVEQLPELPREIIFRPKRGFTFPFEQWLRREMRAEVEGILQAPDDLLDPVLEPSAVRSVWSEFLAGRSSWSRPWALYVLKCWCARHVHAHQTGAAAHGRDIATHE